MSGKTTLILLPALAAGAAWFAWWIYFRREVAARGRAGLAVLRGLVLGILALLVLDPAIPRSRGALGPERWILLDASLSMGAGAGPTPWDSAVARALSEESGGAPVVLFGDRVREVRRDSLPRSGPEDLRSSLEPGLRAALEAGVGEVVVLSDLRLDDPLAVREILARFPGTIRFAGLDPGLTNATLDHLELPETVGQGERVPVRLRIGAEGLPPTDSLRVELRLDGDLVEVRTLTAPVAGRWSVQRIELPGVGSPGLHRLEARVVRDGDAFPDDDARVAWIEVDPEESGILLLSLRPDWEIRFLLPVLQQVTGLPVRGYLAVAGDRFLPMEGGGAPISIDRMRRMLGASEVVVLHGLDAGTWARLGPGLGGGARLLVFPADGESVRALGLAAGPPARGEWYLAPELPASPLAGELTGLSPLGLAPLTGIIPLSESVGVTVPLVAQRQGSGPGQAVLALDRSGGRRRAVALGTGYWRWAFRGEGSREYYRRLWSSVAGWLLADEATAQAGSVRPTSRLVSRGAPVEWRAPVREEEAPLRLVIRSADGGTVVDTTFPGSTGPVRTPALEPGPYDFRATVGEREAGEGRFEVERFSREGSIRPVELPATAGGFASGEGGARVPVPLRTSPWPYLLILGLLCAEWILRRRRGLR